MKSTAYAVFMIMLAIAMVQAGKSKRPKFCMGKNNIKYEKNEGYTEGCTQFICVKKGKKFKMMSKQVPKCEDGVWSAWSSYSACSASCGPATKSRTRTCSNPAPANGGKPCPGLNQQTMDCQLSPCQESEPDLAANVTAIEASMQFLNESMESIESKFEALQSSVESILGMMTTMQSTSKSLETNISSNMEAINTNKKSISKNEGFISVNKDTISTNNAALAAKNTQMEMNITSNMEAINTNKESISTNNAALAAKDTQMETNISSNMDGINTNKKSITKNEGFISVNKDTISTNNAALAAKDKQIEMNITSNMEAINTNKESISTNNAALVAKDTQMETNISSNMDGINTNKKSITTNEGFISVNKDKISTNHAALAAKDTQMEMNITSNMEAINTNKESISTNNAALAAKDAQMESCFADISSSNCPSPASGKTSVAGGISSNTAALDDKCDASTCSDIQEAIAEFQKDVNIVVTGGLIIGNLKSSEIISPGGVCSQGIPPLPVAVRSHQSVYFNKSLMVCGGYGDNGRQKRCHQLRNSNSQWTEGPAMNVAKNHFSMTKAGQDLYALGGSTDAGYIDSMEKLSGSSGEWTLMDQKLTSIRAHHCTVFMKTTNSLVTVGGYSSTTLNVVDEFNLATLTWKQLPSLPMAVYEPACVALDQTIVAIGGYNSGGGGAQKKVYQFSGGNWQTTGELEIARRYHTVGIIDNKLIVIGGLEDPDGIEEIEDDGNFKKLQKKLSKKIRYHASTEVPRNDFTCS